MSNVFMCMLSLSMCVCTRVVCMRVHICMYVRMCSFALPNVSNMCIYVRTCVSTGDYNSLTSDTYRSFWLNVQPLIHYLSNAMYGCMPKLYDIMAIGGFWLIISANL